MKKVIVAIVLVALSAILFAAISSGYQSYVGYCPNTGNHLSDDDAIHSALRHALLNQMREDSGFRSKNSKPKTLEYYLDEQRRLDIYIDEFISNNEGCCSIGPVPGDESYVRPTVINMVLGFVSRVVVVDGIGLGSSKRRVQYAVDRCGHVRLPD